MSAGVWWNFMDGIVKIKRWLAESKNELEASSYGERAGGYETAHLIRWKYVLKSVSVSCHISS